MTQGKISKIDLCSECNISPLETKRMVHLLLFMHKQLYNEELLNNSKYNTRLHQLQFSTCINQTMKRPNKIYFTEVLYLGMLYRPYIEKRNIQNSHLG